MDGKKINMEIQIYYDDSYADITLFYWAKILTSRFKKGNEYGDLAETICINITDSPMFEYLEYHSTHKQVNQLIG